MNTYKHKATRERTIRNAGEEHGEQGHLNSIIKDQDSIVTGYGAHGRVIAFLPKGDEFELRVDLVWGLRRPTASEMLDVARRDQGIKGKWRMVSSVEYHSHGLDRIDATFKR